MAALIHKQGDLFNTEAHGIGHGVNTLGVMGHGIAVKFRDIFPEMYQQYRHFCETKQLVPGTTFIYEPEDGYFVYNIASQDMPGANARLEWLRAGLEGALKHADLVDLGTLALPRIGAGIGGLVWEDVLALLTELAESHKTDIEVWTL